MTDTVNNFGPLTPEQQAMLQRQALGDAPSPFDVLPGTIMGAGIGAGMAGIGGLRSLVQGLQQRGMRADAIGEYLKGIGVVGGATAGAGLSFDVFGSTPYKNSIRDAEGQPGGFYGENRRARIMRELMK